ncbi:hypothetical protein [Eggerthella guodeyinii]|uniref:Uncharacterized protein n=1 Tax=Eggerthella guodeyinii TaxID=2690837 RepID=A0A6N7RJE2_9ACTN|nr:hypothetical protein [Eggerthella guodeyinii]MRX81101.1 hypothetical protein [Eggerthella guodeyinii]
MDVKPRQPISSASSSKTTDEKGASEHICLDEVLARYDANFEDIKAAGVLDEWEIRDIEQGDYGHLRLSTSVKIVLAAHVPETKIEEAAAAITRFLFDAASRQRKASD